MEDYLLRFRHQDLQLKVGAPVILLRNISNNLANGSKGTVYFLSDDNIVVNFNGVLRNIERCVFERFDTRANEVRGTMLQYPLKLAFALTVHKA